MLFFEVRPIVDINIFFDTLVKVPAPVADIICIAQILGSFSKPRWRRRRERRQTKGLMSKTIAMHVRFESLYISLPSSAKQRREMSKRFYVFWRT